MFRAASEASGSDSFHAQSRKSNNERKQRTQTQRYVERTERKPVLYSDTNPCKAEQNVRVLHQHDTCAQNLRCCPQYTTLFRSVQERTTECVPQYADTQRAI